MQKRYDERLSALEARIDPPRYIVCDLRDLAPAHAAERLAAAEDAAGPHGIVIVLRHGDLPWDDSRDVV